MIVFLKLIFIVMMLFLLCDVMMKWKMGCLSCCGKIKIIKVKFFKVRYICKICGYNKFYLKK